MDKKDLKALYQVMFTEYPDVVTIAQLQKMLGISRRLAYRLIEEGEIPGLIVGKMYKIPKAGVICYFAKNEGGENAR